MDYFVVRVTCAHPDFLDFDAYGYYEDDNLFVSATFGFVPFFDAAHIGSSELAVQFRDAVVALEHGKGHSDFDAELEPCSSPSVGVAETVMQDSRIVRETLQNTPS